MRRNILFLRLFWFIISVVAVVLMVRFFFVSSRVFYPDPRRFNIRVRIGSDAEKVSIAARYAYRLLDGNREGKEKIISTFPKGAKADVYLKSGHFFVNGDKVEADKLIFVPAGRNPVFTYNKIKYKGSIELVRSDQGIAVVNHLDLEDYLKGVIPKEVNHLWPMEALKAQAVASRSFAVNQALKRKNLYYDLRSDTYSQVYGGLSAERWRTNRAVALTKGEVCTYAGKVLPAFFHSCCGGHTENMAVLWGESLPPLEGVVCRWCRVSPYYRWQIRLSSGKIQEKLNKAGYKCQGIDAIREGARDVSGRLKYVSVKTGNRWFDINGWEFLTAIGSRELKSTKMRIQRYPFFYKFSGYGWGHGVGMCQWGAFAQALRWRKYKDILEYYYPGIDIGQLWDVVGQSVWINQPRGF